MYKITREELEVFWELLLMRIRVLEILSITNKNPEDLKQLKKLKKVSNNLERLI
jgi:hypothetical protein